MNNEIRFLEDKEKTTMLKNVSYKLAIFLSALLLISAVIAGCERNDGDQGAEDDRTQPAVSVVLSVAENYNWPSGGHEVILRAEESRGLPWEGSPDSLSISASQPGTGLTSRITPCPMGPGVTLVAVQPGPAADLPVYQDAIRKFIQARPAGERIALYGWGNEFVQIADFTLQRPRLFAQLSRLERVVANRNSLSPKEVFDQAVEVVGRVESPNLKGMRSIVFISNTPPAGAIPRTQEGVALQWVLPARAAAADGPAGVVAIGGASGLENALDKVSRRLDRDAAEAYYKIAVCSNPMETITAQITAGSKGAVAVELAQSLEGEENGSCDVDRITAGERDAVHTVQFFLTEEELVVYQERLDAIQELRAKYADLSDEMRRAMILMDTTVNGWGTTKDDFNLTVSLDPSFEPVKAKAHLRGQNALFCGRKSYTVNLSGKDARFFDQDSGSDEFYLIAMCQDAGLFNAYLADTLYSQFDLFPLKFRYVELKFNGDSQGIYLMMEKRDEELERDNGRLRGVVRRRYEGIAQAEVEHTISDDATMLAAYRKTLARNVSANALPGYLREHMDVDQYLRWMGLNSIIENADTLDECLFISTESVDAAGLPADYFRLMAWDPEDMQGVCPSGDIARNDYDLTFCQESSIERRMINHPVIFDEYVEVLKKMLTEVTPERFQAVLDQVQAELFPLLEREGVVAAMQRPEWTDARSAIQMIREAMDLSRQKFEARLDALEAGLQTYANTSR